jgi:hypothetical protein
MEDLKKGTVLYKKESGSLIIYDGENESGEYLAHIKDSNGYEYPSMLLGSILARGYWDAVYIPESNDKV